jgi:NTP pyrophosphatase (non-canonical NTP hydrolase)
MEFDYLAESALTASGKFYTDNVHGDSLARVLNDCISALQNLDKIKKGFFYGKDFTLDEKYTRDLEASGVSYPDPDFVHGILGIATEAGELLEALEKTLFHDAELDVTNVMEEVSDCQWYEAMLARKAGMTFDEIQRMNIKKLRARFGDKFTEYDAIHRNLDAERVILEEGVAQSK